MRARGPRIGFLTDIAAGGAIVCPNPNLGPKKSARSRASHLALTFLGCPIELTPAFLQNLSGVKGEGVVGWPGSATPMHRFERKCGRSEHGIRQNGGLMWSSGGQVWPCRGQM